MQKIIILLASLFLLTTWKNIYPQTKMHIEIITLGEVDNFVRDYLKENLRDIFKAQVDVGKNYPLPEYAFNKKRDQYLSSVILDRLSGFKKEENKKILAIIDQDMYVPELNFVFGEADILKGFSIISLIRLRQTYYGLKEDKEIFLKRSLKEAVHEIGHLLNLRHCLNPKCVMHFSNSLLDTDIKDYHLCPRCKKSLP